MSVIKHEPFILLFKSRDRRCRSGGTDENGVAANGAADSSSAESGDENGDDKKSKKRQKKKKKKKKTKKGNKSNLLRRNIRDLLDDEHLTETTKEARVSYFTNGSLLGATRKVLTRKVLIILGLN